ncbi:type II toxin-antitoxin system PemK/MazF family toxin [Apilactobacillus timberlakei]|uniref:Type II toxin-antitoxin system PemK/MazF family toxin n=1 Tax=Apilactobacillus timberlakei TaxID=2008380 RepID=A0ABY2YRV2_9LACO|nr:type II toxin-antitoxin system PemK/MazF family toxin [Apilactobacillus timberlakei]TPR12786.1 hypothetical protein DY048_07185 [Apilactobacillus timberlakei]TPR13669.1 hypothetical protein DY052_08055 [Apilactobacillus timberlakei]
MANNIDRLERNSKYALNNYKKVLNNNGHNKKYKHLPDWILSKSKYLLRDYKCYEKNRKVFSRGALVYVDFGVNVGTELSGSHFAIVLTKNDHKRNDKLNVVPLTSHSHEDNIPMNDTILNRSKDNLLKYYINLKFLYLSLIILHKEIFDEDDNLSNEDVKSLKEDWLKGIKKVTDNQSYQYCLTMIDDKERAKVFIKKVHFNYEKVEAMNKLKEKVSKVSKVARKYNNYNKETFIKIADITTVSKARLKRINEYDPIGKIKVSDDILNQIDQKIIEFYTK